MRAILIGLAFIWTSTQVLAQNLDFISLLDEQVAESSGLLKVDGRYITHNDSGDGPWLYEIDPLNGSVLRSVYVQGAQSVDWEDICADQSFIYVGDIGNNAGNRSDLSIVKIPIDEYFNTTSDTVSAGLIAFDYGDQVDFSNQTFSTNFDAEALISYGDSLYIFSKNWGDQSCKVYSCPKQEGSYTLEPVQLIDSQGLVTGAIHNPDENALILTGYAGAGAFIIRATNQAPWQLDELTKSDLTVENTSFQIEAISRYEAGSYLLSAEGGLGGEAGLHELWFSPSGTVFGTTDEEERRLIYPNPSSELLQLELRHGETARLLDANGRLIEESNQSMLEVSGLAAGNYILILLNEEGEEFFRDKVIIEPY